MRKEIFMRTYTNAELAEKMMRQYNRSTREIAPRARTICCLVDGPEDGEWTVCDLKTAIDIGVGYSWSF